MDLTKTSMSPFAPNMYWLNLGVLPFSYVVLFVEHPQKGEYTLTSSDYDNLKKQGWLISEKAHTGALPINSIKKAANSFWKITSKEPWLTTCPCCGPAFIFDIFLLTDPTTYKYPKIIGEPFFGTGLRELLSGTADDSL